MLVVTITTSFLLSLDTIVDFRQLCLKIPVSRDLLYHFRAVRAMKNVVQELNTRLKNLAKLEYLFFHEYFL